MKKIIFYLFFGITTLALTGCARGCEKFKRDVRITPNHIIVRQYSGGQLVFERNFKGIVNTSKTSDGYYFTINDTTFEISGDIQIIEIGK